MTSVFIHKMIENTSDKHKITIDSALNIQQRHTKHSMLRVTVQQILYSSMDCGAKFNPGVSKNNL